MPSESIWLAAADLRRWCRSRTHGGAGWAPSP